MSQAKTAHTFLLSLFRDLTPRFKYPASISFAVTSGEIATKVAYKTTLPEWVKISGYLLRNGWTFHSNSKLTRSDDSDATITYSLERDAVGTVRLSATYPQ